MNTLDFNHAKERRSLHHRYAEVETEVRKMAEAALNNEEITRKRVEHIEMVLTRPFWGRLRWLLTGK